MPSRRKNPEEDVAPTEVEPNGPSHADIQMAVNRQLAFNEERASMNKRIGTFRKGLRAKGITLGTLDAMIRMLEWSPEEIKADFAERQRYAEAMRYPVGTQLELFGTDKTPDGVREQLKWHNIGYKDGLAGRGWANEPPTGCPPECVQEYGKGHEEGAQLVLAAISDAVRTSHVDLEPEPQDEDKDPPAETGLSAGEMEAQLVDGSAQPEAVH